MTARRALSQNLKSMAGAIFLDRGLVMLFANLDGVAASLCNLAAVERAKTRLGDKMPSAHELAAAARLPQQFLERLVVKDGTKVTLIPVAKLDYAEAQDDYVALASQGKKHLKQQTIAGLEAGLDPNSFVRIHRSYIVNLKRVVRIEPYGKDSRLAILADGTRLPVSRAGFARLKALLDERK